MSFVPPPPPPPPDLPPQISSKLCAAQKLPNAGDLQAQLTKVSQQLKPTCTVVSTPDGRVLRESRDKHRSVHTELLSCGSLGFIGDLKPDLQVGNILPGLVMGSQDVAADRSVLRQHVVTHILNVASHVTNAFPDLYTYKTLQILDLPTTRITEQFAECFAFIDAGREAGCVLVHCNAGVSRSATIVIAYLMKRQKMAFTQAFSFVKEMRPSIRPNEGFMKQLRDYDAELSNCELAQ